uniref:Putative plant transposon protein domain-containing protein n=1 Tax=Solanum tuberosum TaxID=4113 RepID=M1DBL6_SOLTU
MIFLVSIRNAEATCHLISQFPSSPSSKVTMSGTQRSGKEVATFSQRKRVRSGETGECNLHMVHEFYANWAPDARSHFGTVRGINVSISPAGINDIVGTLQDTDPLVLTRLNIRPPYRAIRHTLCGPQSMVQWTKHSEKRYHQYLPYAHMLRKAQVWLKIVMHYLIPGLHYTNITWDRVCLVYALMTATEVNIGVVFKSAMRKARVHKGHKYAFGGLITRMCRVAGVPKDNVDYMAPLFAAPMDITRTKGPDTKFGPTLTTAEHHMRDELIMARMYGLEMLRHQNGCLASTDIQLGDVERRYPLNAHAKTLLGIGPEFRDPIDDDIPIVEEHLRTSSDVEFDSDEEVDPAQAGDEAEGGDAMED